MKALKKIIIGVIVVEVASRAIKGESLLGGLLESKAKPSPADTGISLNALEGPQSAMTLAAVGSGPSL